MEGTMTDLTPEDRFRILHHRAADLAADLVRAAEAEPGTFLRDHHTANARKHLAEIADELGFDLAMRIPVDADRVAAE
jgi:hypothetical protein